MRGNDLECYAYGIHIGKLTEKDIEKILQEYYHIKYLPEIQFLLENNFAKRIGLIEDIYYEVLYILLLNGYRLPLNGYNSDAIDPSLYFNDMVMLLYLYVMNQEDMLSSNELQTSTVTNARLFQIEQSGIGNILGIRRENKYKGEKESKSKRKQVKYVAMLPDEWEDYAAKNGTYSVTWNEKKSKYYIPFACKNVVEALLKSRTDNFFIFSTEKEETLSEEEIRSMTDRNASKEFFGGLSLSIFEEEIQKALMLMAVAGGGAQKKLYKYLNPSTEDVDEGKEYKFYKKYFHELEESESRWGVPKEDQKTENDNMKKPNKWEKGQQECEKIRNECIKKANRYLSELLFAYSYYEQIIKNDEFSKFLKIIYEVSKSPACFSRCEHIKQYLKMFFYVSISEKENSRKKIQKMMNGAIRNERYAVRKFLPAFFYCLLYYLGKAGIIKEKYNEDSLAVFEKCIKQFTGFEMLHKKFFPIWLNTPGAKELWMKRKTDYLKPLDYEMGKALF